MLSALVAHAGAPPAPHDLLDASPADALLLAGLLLAAWAHRRGRRGRRRPADRWRARCYLAALAAVAVALLSPLDAAAGALASAHMVQHVLLILVAAPLLALSAPWGTLLAGSPPAPRRAVVAAGRRLRPPPRAREALRHPLTAWLLHVAALWLWHSAVMYDAALSHDLIHAAEHATFLLTAVLFWRVVLGPRGMRGVSPGLGILLVFAMALQSTFLSVLLTFARQPWYSSYAASTQAWGLDALADQQLAGAIMWVPAGFIYLAAGLGLLAAWLQRVGEEDPASPRRPIVGAER